MIEILGIASMVFVAWFTWYAYTQAPTPGQTPRSSIVEAWINIVIGFSINFVMNLLVIPMAIDAHLSLWANWWMGWIFTVVSIVRQYVIRRWFNASIHRAAKRLAEEIL